MTILKKYTLPGLIALGLINFSPTMSMESDLTDGYFPSEIESDSSGDEGESVTTHITPLVDILQPNFVPSQQAQFRKSLQLLYAETDQEKSNTLWEDFLYDFKPSKNAISIIISLAYSTESLTPNQIHALLVQVSLKCELAERVDLFVDARNRNDLPLIEEYLKKLTREQRNKLLENAYKDLNPCSIEAACKDIVERLCEYTAETQNRRLLANFLDTISTSIGARWDAPQGGYIADYRYYAYALQKAVALLNTTPSGFHILDALKTYCDAANGLNTLSDYELINLIDSASKTKFAREYALDSLALITARLKKLKQRVTNLAKDNPATPFARWVAFHRVPLRSLAQITDELTRRERTEMLIATAPDDGYWEQPEWIYQEDALIFFKDVQQIVTNNQLPVTRIKMAAAAILSLAHENHVAKFNDATEETVKKANPYRYPLTTRLKKAYGAWKGWIGLGALAGLTVGAWWTYSHYKPALSGWLKNSLQSSFLAPKSGFMAYTGLRSLK